MTLYASSNPVATQVDIFNTNFSQASTSAQNSAALDYDSLLTFSDPTINPPSKIFSGHTNFVPIENFSPTQGVITDFSKAFIFLRGSENFLIDQSQQNRSTVNMNGIILEDSENTLIIKGNESAPTITKVGLLKSVCILNSSAISVENNGNLMIDSGLINSSITTKDNSIITFGAYTAGGQNPLIARHFVIGVMGKIDTTRSLQNSLTIPKRQTVELSDRSVEGGFLSGTGLNPLIKTGTLTNQGTLILGGKGIIQGNIINNGDVKLDSSASIQGNFLSQGVGNAITLITEKQLTITKNVTLDVNTKTTVQLKYGGGNLVDTDLSNLLSSSAINANVTTVLNKLPAVLKITESANLAGNLTVSSLGRVSAGSIFKLLTASSITGKYNLSSSNFQLIEKLNSLYIVALSDIPASLNSYVAPLNRVFSYTSPQLIMNFSGNQFMNQFSSGVSFDMNATKMQLGAFAVTTSADLSSKSNFMGMNFKVSGDASFIFDAWG